MNKENRSAPTPDIGDFPHTIKETVRYNDTDRQGHVNNAVFSTFLECARTGILYDKARGLNTAHSEFVIIKMELDYLAELQWPGEVEIGTRIQRIGRSSLIFEQAIFQQTICAAQSTNVMVLIDTDTRQSTVLPANARRSLSDLVVAE